MSRRTSTPTPDSPLRPMGARKATRGMPPAAPPTAPARKWNLPDYRLVIILVLSASLGIAFAWTTPRGANPDESAHLQYVRVVATELRLPALDLEHRKRVGHSDTNYEAHQPPLYYVLAAPFYHVGNALDAQDGPYRACRLLSILIGLFGTGMVWLLAKELAPNRPGIWIAASAFAAFLPMRLAVTASVSNDPLAEAAGTASLLLIVRALKGHWAKRDWLWLGVALGVALIAKQSSLLLLPVAALAVILASNERATSEKEPSTDQLAVLLRSGAVVFGVVALIAGWFFIRNHFLYGDPLAKKAFDAYFADAYLWENFRAGGFTFQQYLFDRVFPTAFTSFWGWFGYMTNDQANLALGAYGAGPPSRWGYPPRSWLMPILGKVLLVALAGLVVYLVRRRLEPQPGDVRTARNPEAGLGVALLALHAAFVFGAFLNFNTTYFQAQGRYLFPAIAAIALAVSAGLLEWPRAAALIGAGKDRERWLARARSWELVAGWGVAAAALTLACYAYFGVLVPGFSHS